MQKDPMYYPDQINQDGVTAYNDGKMMKAIKLFKQALSLNQTYVEAYVNLGVTYSDCGLKDDAVKAFEKAYLLDPNYLDKYGLKVDKREDECSTHKKLAVEYLSKNQFEDALLEIDIACSRKPSYPDLHNIRGVILIKMKRYEEAFEAINKALELNPEYDTARSNLALIHYQRGLHYFETGLEKEAIREWKRSLITDPVKSMVKLHLSQEKDKITMKITCPGCREMLNLEWKFCPFCGSRRRQDTP